MSSIDKMSIQGIRSFGPDDKDKQIIQFYSPLTLILGPNGTGKTTVIECLKYMTTGEMPPGTKQGGAFVHDPKVAHESEVKAQVRLQFFDVRGQQCVSQRSLVATQKAKNVTLKTLDSTIDRRLPDGSKQHISSKCAEMDREMVSLLGVAKPVLENVIFCHQEDANWPLSEGKALKQKFDDIFASTRYVKALEAIRKLRLEQKGQIDVYKGEMKYLKQNKEKAAQIRGDLEDSETRYLASKEDVDKLTKKIEPIDQQLRILNSKRDEIYKLQTKIEKLKSEKSQMERNINELASQIKNEFQGSIDDLKLAKAQFEKEVEANQEKSEQCEVRQIHLITEIEDLNDERGNLLMEQGRLQSEAERHQQRIKNRDKLISRTADTHDLSGFSGSISERHVERLVQELKDKYDTLMQKARDNREVYEKKETDIQKEIDGLRHQKTSAETEVKLKMSKISENKEEVRNLNQKLSKVDVSGERLKDLERDIKRTSMELSEAQKAVDLDKLAADITVMKNEKLELDSKLKVLDTELNRLSLESSARSQVEVYRKDKTSKEENCRKMKAKNEDSLLVVLGSVPKDNFKRAVDNYVTKQSACVRQSTDDLDRMKRRLAAAEASRNMHRDQERKRDDELRCQRDKIREVSESQDFDEGIEKLEENMKKNREIKGTLEGSKFIYEKYQRSLEKEDPPCPLCHRPFDSPGEVEELINSLQDKLNLVPDKLDKVNKAITKSDECYRQMLQLKPVRDQIKQLEDQEMPQLRVKIKTFTEQIDDLSTNINSKEEELDVLRSDEAMAKSMQPDMMMIDRYMSEIRELDRKISAQSSKLSGGDSGRTMQQVTGEREDVQIKLEGLNRNLEHKRQKQNDHTERLQYLNSGLLELKNEKVQRESDLQQSTHWEEQKLQLQTEISTLRAEVEDGKTQLAPLEAEVRSLLEKKELTTRKKERKFEEEKEQASEVKDKEMEINKLHDEVTRYLTSGQEKKLDKCQRLLDSLVAKAEKVETEKKKVQAEIDSIRKELDSQQTRKRELEDNITLRKRQTEVSEIQERMVGLNEELGGLDVNNLDRDRRRLGLEYEALTKQKHTAQGRQGGLEDQLRRFRKELKEDQYKDAEEKHNDKLVLLKTTEMANEDLDKYYKALDRTIMSYHKMKMDEINKIIQELWRNTYKGNDIETIEIRSDEANETGATKTRRTYNYRVVMIKGDAVLDMRGRCSAGQKVLASLIIRLALAETFCLNCGILALDEPTTNLDRENIESLAFALVDIIKSRKRQRNFQLVIITHDEDFVELLGRSDYVDEFFKVGKDQFGCSRLARAKVQELHR